jgi:hypothetical protein
LKIYLIGNLKIKKILLLIYKKNFYKLWDVGFKAYIDGDWEEAKKVFEQTLVKIFA